MANAKTRKTKNQSRRRRIRAKIIGTAERPRLSVFKSNRHFFIQLIDDMSGKTLMSTADRELKLKKGSMKVIAYELGKLLAKKASDKKMAEVVFDRGGYKYHGAILELARGAREGGLKF
jgi:large subunit ribosomal protein L18